VLENGVVIRRFPLRWGRCAARVRPGEFGDHQPSGRTDLLPPRGLSPPGSGNPLGPRWVGLISRVMASTEPMLPVHRKAASHGCIRLRNPDIGAAVHDGEVGDTVEIRGERDEQIARIFGGEVSAPVAVAQARSLAQWAAGNRLG